MIRWQTTEGNYVRSIAEDLRYGYRITYALNGAIQQSTWNEIKTMIRSNESKTKTLNIAGVVYRKEKSDVDIVNLRDIIADYEQYGVSTLILDFSSKIRNIKLAYKSFIPLLGSLGSDTQNITALHIHNGDNEYEETVELAIAVSAVLSNPSNKIVELHYAAHASIRAFIMLRSGLASEHCKVDLLALNVRYEHESLSANLDLATVRMAFNMFFEHPLTSVSTFNLSFVEPVELFTSKRILKSFCSSPLSSVRIFNLENTVLSPSDANFARKYLKLPECTLVELNFTENIDFELKDQSFECIDILIDVFSLPLKNTFKSISMKGLDDSDATDYFVRRLLEERENNPLFSFEVVNRFATTFPISNLLRWIKEPPPSNEEEKEEETFSKKQRIESSI